MPPLCLQEGLGPGAEGFAPAVCVSRCSSAGYLWSSACQTVRARRSAAIVYITHIRALSCLYMYQQNADDSPTNGSMLRVWSVRGRPPIEHETRHAQRRRRGAA